MNDLLSRITAVPHIRDGQPHILGTYTTVAEIMEYYKEGLTAEKNRRIPADC